MDHHFDLFDMPYVSNLIARKLTLCKHYRYAIDMDYGAVQEIGHVLLIPVMNTVCPLVVKCYLYYPV